MILPKLSNREGHHGSLPVSEHMRRNNGSSISHNGSSKQQCRGRSPPQGLHGNPMLGLVSSFCPFPTNSKSFWGQWHWRSHRLRRFQKRFLLIALLILPAFHIWSWGPSTSSTMEKEFVPLPDHPKTPRGRVFSCGFKVPIAEYLFPDYEYIGDARDLSEMPDVFENDILVFGLWGHCDGYDNLQEIFPGKILYVNAESRGNPVKSFWNKHRHREHRNNITEDRVYQIGPYPPSNNETVNSEFGKFVHAHSLQVYHTAVQFMGYIYLPTRRFDDHHFPQRDIDLKDTVNDSSVGIQPQTKANDNKSYRAFDPWKQLVKGNGRSSASGPEPPRIPAVVYVAKNCVPYRQDAAKLLAREFQDLAISGMKTKSETDSQTRRRLGETSNGTTKEDSWNATTDVEALHKRAAEFNEARKKSRSSNNNNNEPQSILQRAIEENLRYHEENLPIVIVDRDGNEILEASFVHYGGKCKVSGGIAVPPLKGWKNKNRDTFRSNYKTIYTRYKYCLVMENTKKDGYVTEKLMHALLGGCLPIYYGTKEVYDIFRNDSFVYMDIENPRPALDEIRRLENDPDEYLRRTDRRLPLLKAASNDDPYDTTATVDSYFSVLPGIGTGKLCREIHEMMGLEIPEFLIPAKESSPSSFFSSNK